MTQQQDQQNPKPIVIERQIALEDIKNLPPVRSSKPMPPVKPPKQE